VFFIIAPKALMAAADLYREKMQDSNAAQTIYSKIISEYPASPQASLAAKLMNI